MVALRCPCGGEHEIWGELWWVGGNHEWVFFDDLETSETHAEQIMHCPGCGRRLERRNLKKTVGPDRTGWRLSRATAERDAGCRPVAPHYAKRWIPSNSRPAS